uniref:Uncharacterized protein n=1 Tax=Moniliophthora roreri TaxID=221103 RepID=A0A0W0G914_MONRR
MSMGYWMTESPSTMRNPLGLGGSTTDKDRGVSLKRLSRIVWATSTQFNLVNATIEAAGEGKIGITSFTRIPSSINYVHAMFPDPAPRDVNGI